VEIPEIDAAKLGIALRTLWVIRPVLTRALERPIVCFASGEIGACIRKLCSIRPMNCLPVAYS